MNQVVAFNPAKPPAFAKRGVSDMAKSLAGGATGGKRISIKGSAFRLLSGGKEIASIEDRFLDVVFVKAAPKVNRVFYAKQYDADNIVGPDCWSADGDKPSPDAAAPQATRCAECPKNIAGSGQGNSRACRYQQRLAVVLANDVEGSVLQLVLPATSVFGEGEGDKRQLQAYARWLGAQSINPEEVVTRMQFDLKAESPKLFFKTMRWLTDEEFEVVERQALTDDAIKAVTMTVAKMDKVAEPLAIEGKRPTKRAPVVEEVEEAVEEAPKAKAAPVEEEVEEPVVRKEPVKKPAAGNKSSLADMVSDWDDE